MSRPRAPSESSKTPHPISLKVLRLSRPGFSAQCPLPKQSPEGNIQLDPRAALSCPSSLCSNNFFLSPLLNLPPSFGTVYVGETLCATICANNETDKDADSGPNISNIRLTADLQTPSRREPTPLEFEQSDANSELQSSSLLPGATLQRVLRFGLREEGNHVLAVTISYTETQPLEQEQGENKRTRTFRKLYQFVAQQLLTVRTKSREISFGKGGHILEAQLENLGQQAIRIQAVKVNPRPPYTCRSMNAWDEVEREEPRGEKPTLQPGNILQAAFLLEPNGDESKRGANSHEGRVTLGQVEINWRAAMGEHGSLNTGWLTTTARKG